MRDRTGLTDVMLRQTTGVECDPLKSQETSWIVNTGLDAKNGKGKVTRQIMLPHHDHLRLTWSIPIAIEYRDSFVLHMKHHTS